MRRTWMLLLVTVLLAVFLAVPAMAADCSDCDGANHCHTCNGTHEHGEGWTALTASTTKINASGKYYVPEGGVVLNSSISIGKDGTVVDVTICLNGQELSSASGRPLYIGYKSVLNIVDCSPVNAETGVTAGKLKGTDLSTAEKAGGLLYIDGTNTEVNIHAGTLYNGKGSNGGNICVGKKAVVNIYGGVISGGVASSNGGNIYFNDKADGAELNIYGGTITGGSGLGGNIYVHTDAAGVAIYIDGGTISNGVSTGSAGNIYVGPSDASLTMESGLITGGQTAAGKFGGNISTTDAFTGDIKLLGGTVSNGNATDTGCGGNIYSGKGKVTVDGATISGGHAKLGGNIYMAYTANTLTIKRGSISGGTSVSYGGNIYASAASINLVGGGVDKDNNAVVGSITDGESGSHGGNIYLTSAKLTLGQKDVAETDALNASAVITNGWAKNKHGGNIYVASGTVTMYYGTISNGKGGKDSSGGNGHGANLRLTGTMNMYGGVIVGGKTGVTDTAAGSASGNSNVHIYNAKLSMSGGRIYGRVDTLNNSDKYPVLEVSGSAKIYDEDNDGDGLFDAGAQLLTPLVIAGKLNNDAKIAVQMKSGNTAGTTTELVYDAENSYAGIANDWAGYVQNRQLVGFDSKWLTWQVDDEGAGIATYKSEGTTADLPHLWHCVCGYNPFEERGHIGSCNGTDLEWKAYKLTGSNTLPVDTGNWYLVEADTNATDKTVVINAAVNWTGATAKTVNIDFNGITVTYGGTSRLLRIWSSSSAGATHRVTLTDSSALHNGGIDNNCVCADHSLTLWIRATLDTEEGFHYMDIYHITIDARDVDSSTKTNGKAGLQVDAGELNLYNATVWGSTNANSAKGPGAAISLAKGTKATAASEVNIVNSTIYGGNATQGGAVYATGSAAKFTITGSTIYGGTVTTSGGAIYTACPVVEIEDSVIYGGTAGAADGTGGTGGAIMIEGGSVTIDGTRIVGGTTKGSSGGGIYAKGQANLTITDSVITNKTGKTLEDGSAETVPASSGTSGGALYATGCTVYIERTTIEGFTAGTNGALILQINGTMNIKGCTLHGTTAECGAAIFQSGGSLTLAQLELEGGSSLSTRINGGTAQARGGAIYLEENGELNIGTGVYISGGTATPVLKADESCSTHALGGNIFVEKGTVNLEGGTIEDGIAKNTKKNCDGCRGGNLYVQAGTINLKSGTIDNGEAGTAGNIFLSSSNTTMNMGEEGKSVTDELNSSVKVTSGKAYYKHGGNIYIGGAATLNLYYGTISGGEAKEQGGNIRVDGKMYMYEGIIKDAYTGQNFGLYAREDSNMLIYNAATFHMSGGHIHGHVKTLNYGTTAGDTADIALSGDAKIYATNSNPLNGGLYLDEDGDDVNRVALSGLTANAKVGFTCESAESGRQLTVAPISGDCVLTGLFYCKNTYKLRLDDAGNLCLVSEADATGATVNGGSFVVTVPEAIEMATGNDFVKLLSDYEGEQLVVAGNLNLDLNGKKIVNGLKLTGGELKLVDSANAAYVDNSITNGNRLTIETEGGTIARAFVTGGFTNYGHNYRFLVLKHENGTYSAHRIYLAVQNPVLYPMKAAMSFKTVLGCDATVAGYIGEYGVSAAGPDGSDKSNYLLNDGTVVLPYEGKNQNAMTTAVVNIITGAESDADWAVTELKGQAYIKLNDYFYGVTEEGTPVVGVDVTSAQKGTSLQQLVKAIDGMTLSNPQKVAVAQMYTKYSTLMSGWNLDNISSYAANIGLIERHCLCGDTSSKNNACAASGHKLLDWQPLPTDFKAGTLASGNYYLTENNLTDGVFKQTGLITVSEGSMVCLDTKGFDITSPSRLANVFGVFNLTNSNKATEESFISMSCNDDGNGGLLILSTGNVSLYKGITLQGAKDHKIKEGLVQANGSLNVYGANIIGTTLIEGKEAPGGAVYVGATGYFFINDGTIEAGDNNDRGGAIYTVGQTYIQGNAKLVAGTGTRTGGMIYVGGGNVKIDGVTVDLSESEVDYGTFLTQVGGEVEIANTTITGGTAKKGGVFFLNAGEMEISESEIVDGYAKAYTTTEEKDGVTTTTYHQGVGGAFYAEEGFKLTVKDSTVDGGKASQGGIIYSQNSGTDVKFENCTIKNGVAIRDIVIEPVTKDGKTTDTEVGKGGNGANLAIVGGKLTLENSTVENGRVLKPDLTTSGFDNDDNHGGYGGSVLYAAGGTTYITNSKLYGNITNKDWKHGGTIFNNGADIEATGSTITASYANTDGTVLYNNGTNASFTMTDTILDASVLHDVEGLESVTYAGAVRNANADFTMNGDKSEIRGFTIHYSNGGGTLYVTGADSTIVMNGGTISGGSGKDGDSYGGNVSHYGGTFTMNGGTITGGTASSANGGNVYVYGGTFTLAGGTISGIPTLKEGDENYLYSGVHAIRGGNIYVAGGTFSMTGGTVTNGVAQHGGNIYVSEKGTANLSGGVVENGFAVRLNNKSDGHGGNLYNIGNTTLSNNVIIRDGKATHTNGNVYSNAGTFTMTGGTITGGKEYNDGKKDFIFNTATNLFVVTSNFTMTGGQIDGGVTINNYGGDWTTRDTVFMKIGGTAQINVTNGNPNGMSLLRGEIMAYNPETEKNEGTGTYYRSPVFVIDDLMTSTTASAVISSSTDEMLVERPKNEDGSFAMDDAQWQNVIAKAKTVLSTNASQKLITYEEDGIYLRTPAEGTRYGCSCGAAAGEEHTGDCKGYDVLWTAWSGSNLPNQPGYWYLSNKDTVVEASTSYLNRDFLLNADGSLKYTEGGVHPFAVVSVVNSDNQPTGTIKYHDGKEWLDYELQEGEKLVTSYEVYLDLNGHKIDCANGGRVYSFYGIVSDLNGVAGLNSKRQAAAHLTVIDSSEGHTGGMSTAGVYGTKDSFGINSQPQGSIIWMPYEQDSLTTCNVELNASSATHGRGNALETAGTVHLWNTRIIGGTATDYVHKDGNLRANAAGGGAVVITSTGNVTMHGGSITGGKAISEWVRLDYGEMYTSCLGGANVFVSGGIFTMDGGVISGGEVWVENGSKANDLLRSMPGVGGGVYIHGDGEFHVKGDAKVLDNYYYTYTVNNNGTPDNYYDDTYVCQKTEKKASNVYIGSGAIYNDGLTDGARIGLHRNAYEGVLAYTTSDCSAYLYRDDTNGQISGAIFDGQNQALALGNAQYRVGYGMSNIQPTDKDLKTGLSLNGYGNTAVRTTDKLYNTDSISMDSLENSIKLQQLAEFKKHSDLAATAVAITDAQGDTVLLISVDLTSAGSDTVNTAKDMISLKTGIPKQNIVISAGHQHSCPSVSTIYYKNAAGAYTNANGTVLTADQDRVVKTDYARTFYHGVVNAAVQALNDRKEATVTAGILDTTSGGNQYNFVRNKTVTVLKDYTHTYSKGTINYGAGQTYNMTDNHYGIESGLYDKILAAHKVKETGGTPTAEQQELIDTFSVKYESEIDTTMQLVKFDRGEGNTPIVLANFQTHPHKAGGSTNYQVHSDVVGAFRYYLKGESGAEVIYFSGASGNVNTTGSLDYFGKSTDNQVSITDSLKKKNTSYVKLAKSAHYGESLAALASAFISGEGKMKPVTAARDVAVTTRTVEYTIQAPNITAGAISRINEEFLHWNGGEQDGKYHDGYDPTTFQSELWWKMVGQFSYEQANEKIYSAYHASRAYTRYKAYDITGDTTGEISISAYNIGGIGFVAAPYEMFQESGQAIKGNVPGSTYVPKSGAKNAFEYTIIASQANGGHGYIATEVAYDNGGGYSSTDNSLFAEGTAETLVEEYVSMLNGMYK